MARTIAGIATFLLLVANSRGADDDPKAAPRYAVVDLGTGGGPRSTARAINDKGQVVGSIQGASNETSRAVLWEAGRANFLAPANLFSHASDINDRGQVVLGIEQAPLPPAVEAEREAREPRTIRLGAFLWDSGRILDLKAGAATGINERGQVVGFGAPAASHHAFLWESGQFLDLNTRGVPEGIGSFGYAINDRGQVVGATTLADGTGRGFLWDGGEVTDLGRGVGPLAINNKGLIVGSATTATSGYHAFLWTEARMRDLGQLARGTGSVARAINDRGQVVGMALTQGIALPHAFLWEEGALRDLNELIPADSGWILEEANDIDERGRIVGTGRLGDRQRAFLLRPL